jgi:hypothetical protein
MPQVIFNIGFTPSKANKSWSIEQKADWILKRAFYTCNAEYNYFSYSLNPDKVEKNVNEDTPWAYDPETNGSRRGSYMEKSSGAFNEDGVLSNKQKHELEEKLKTTKSNIWHGFISFSNELTTTMDTQTAAIEFVKKTMESYFNNTHLKRDNIEAVYSLHTDTDNRHIHFMFFEKEPMHANAKGQLSYTKKGLIGRHLTQEELDERTEKINKMDIDEEEKKNKIKKLKYFDYARDNFLLSANLFFEENSYSLKAARDITMETLKAIQPRVAQERELRNARGYFSNLRKKLPTTGRLSYNSENMDEFRKRIDNGMKMLCHFFPELNTAYRHSLSVIAKKKKEMQTICRTEKINYQIVGAPRINAMYDDLRSRIGNHILKIAKTETFDKFSDPMYVSNNLARKIAAKKARTAVWQSCEGAAQKKKGSLLMALNDLARIHTNQSINFHELHRIEWESMRADMEYEERKRQGNY